MYARAVDEGKLHVSAGWTVDYEDLMDRQVAVRQSRRIMNPGTDRYNAGVFAKDLECRCIPVSLVARNVRALNTTIKLVRDIVIRRCTHHRGVAFLNWQIGNSAFYKDVNENTKMVKDVYASHRKIDAVIAQLCAIKVAEENAVVEKCSN